MLKATVPVLPSLDLSATQQFYERLGFGLVSKYENDYLILKRDGQEMHFFFHGGLEPEASFFGCYWRVEDAAGLFEYYQRLALPNLLEPEIKPWGVLEFAFLDPDGNLIRIGEEIGEEIE
ncbi:MAG: VOC family protein [Bryobacter sp.]